MAPRSGQIRLFSTPKWPLFDPFSGTRFSAMFPGLLKVAYFRHAILKTGENRQKGPQNGVRTARKHPFLPLNVVSTTGQLSVGKGPRGGAPGPKCESQRWEGRSRHAGVPVRGTPSAWPFDPVGRRHMARISSKEGNPYKRPSVIWYRLFNNSSIRGIISQSCPNHSGLLTDSPGQAARAACRWLDKLEFRRPVSKLTSSRRPEFRRTGAKAPFARRGIASPRAEALSYASQTSCSQKDGLMSRP